MNEIVLWMEKHFGVKVGKAHRRWQSIASRKRVGYAKFLEEMKLSIEKRVEEEFSR